MEFNMVGFSKRLRASRKAAHIKQAEVASLLGGKSDTSVSNWEHGRCTPTLEEIAAIAQEFQRRGHPVTSGWLAFGEGPSPEELRWVEAIRSLPPEQRAVVLSMIDGLCKASMKVTDGGAGLVSAPYLMSDYSSPDRAAESPQNYGKKRLELAENEEYGTLNHGGPKHGAYRTGRSRSGTALTEWLALCRQRRQEYRANRPRRTQTTLRHWRDSTRNTGLA